MKVTALVPLNRTSEAPVKFVPVIVTLVVTGPLAGVKLVIVGGLAVTVKLLALVAVPPGVVTLIWPLVAPLGTVAAIEVAEFTVKLTAFAPLNVTAVVPMKAVPLIVTMVPTGPFGGVKLVIVGAGAGAALDTVTVTGAEVVVVGLPLPWAMAVRVCEPLLAVVVSHEIENGAVAAGGPRGAPSSRNWTFETRTLPVAVALTVIVPATGDPEAGDVMVTTRPSF